MTEETKEEKTKGIKIYLDAKLEERFRKAAMMVYGYGKGSISHAAEEAIERWTINATTDDNAIKIEDPVEAIAGMLSKTKKSSVELQHLATELRIKRALHHR